MTEKKLIRAVHKIKPPLSAGTARCNPQWERHCRSFVNFDSGGGSPIVRDRTPQKPRRFLLSAIRDTRPPLLRYSLIIYLLDRVFLRPYNFRGSKEAPSASALASYPTAHLLALMQILTGSSSFFENLSLSLSIYDQSPSSLPTMQL